MGTVTVGYLTVLGIGTPGLENSTTVKVMGNKSSFLLFWESPTLHFRRTGFYRSVYACVQLCYICGEKLTERI